MHRLALIGLLALVSSACTLDVDLAIDLTPSGGGAVSVDIVTDEEFESLFALTGREFEDLVASRGADIGVSFMVVQGDRTRYFADGAGVSAETLTGIIEGLFPGIGSIAIDPGETELEFDGRLNALTAIDDVARYFEGVEPAQFADDVDVTVKISPPGALDSSTATEVGEGDLVWNIPFADTPTRVFARTLIEQESGPVISWTLLVGLATLATAVGFLYAIRTRLEQETSQTTATGPVREANQPDSTPPEEQAVGPNSQPPEAQAVAPPAEAS